MLGANEGGIDNENRLAEIEALFQQIQNSNDDKINCKGCAMYPHEFEKLVGILKGKTFSKLDLSYNCLNPDFSKLDQSYKFNSNSVPALLQSVILNNNALVEIKLSFNQLDDAFVDKLVNNSDIQKRLPSIDLDLSGNRIHDQSIKLGIPYFSMMTVSSMVTATPVQNLQLVRYVDEIVGEYLTSKDAEEEKTLVPRAPIRFFDLLPKTVQINNPTLAFDDEEKSPRLK